MRRDLGNRIGRSYSRCCKAACPRIGWCSYWQIVACMLHGSSSTSSQLAGIQISRINLGGKVRPVGDEKWVWLWTLVPQTGTAWSGHVDCFVGKTLRCTLLARWDEGYADPLLILTDLAPEAANVVWYALRSWIEGGFKAP